MANTSVNAQSNTAPVPANDTAAVKTQPSQNLLDDVCVVENEKAQNTKVLERPALGQSNEITLENSQHYIFGFAKSDVTSMVEKDGDLTITFNCGGTLVLHNYRSASTGESASTFAFAAQGDLSSMIKVVDTTKIDEENALKAQKHASSKHTGEKLANIEPAAGDEANAKKLANIEPAAGDAGGAGGGHGYGFNSRFDDTPVGPLNAVGPLGATSLQYSANFRQPHPLVGQNDNPINIGPNGDIIDETNLAGGPIVVSHNIDVDFGADGFGSIGPDGFFTSAGSQTGGALSSNGVPVVVTQTADGYIGKAGDVTVFTLVIHNDASGQYDFTLFKSLDHADGTNPNDQIGLIFGVKATDADGDAVNTSITIVVADDAPSIAGDGVKTINEDDIGHAVVTGDLIENFGQDGHGNIHTTGTTSATGDVANGVLSSGGHAVTITSTANGYTGTANGQTVFTLTIDPNTGAYTFTLLKALDHSAGGDTIFLNFGAEIVDYDGDTARTDITIKVIDDVPHINNDHPTVGNGLENIDETNLGPIVVNGHVTVDFGADTPGHFGANGTTSHSGSELGGKLTSHGVDVVISQTATGYVGKAGDVTVFTMTINNDGTYSFVLNKPLDHADGNDPNDVIKLTFGVTATDADGDTANGQIIVNIADDVPTISGDGLKVISEHDIGPAVVHGDLVENFGHDGQGNIHTTGTWTATGDLNGGVLSSGGKQVVVTSTPTGYVGTANGQTVFTLTLNQTTGAYDFTLLKPLDHSAGGSQITLNFGAEIVDYDGDKAQTNIMIKVIDDVPHINIGDHPVVGGGLENVDETNLGPIVRDGHVNYTFGGDGPGHFGANGNFTSGGSKLGGNLTSHGIPVVVTADANGYVGKANGVTIFTLAIDANGDYHFTLNGVLDHADGTNPDDSITLNFGVSVSDSDGDSDSGMITVNVKDDGPVAVNDGNFSNGNVINGNVLANDNPGHDGLGQGVTSVTYNGTVHPIAAGGSIDIVGQYGTLHISANGEYTYTPKGGVDGTDNFTYKMEDYDHDTSTAQLSIRVDNDDCPIIVKPAVEVVDETNLGPIVETGHVDANYFSDGPGAITANGQFSSTGSKLGGNLTSHGVPVVVTSTATGYVGKANGTEIFTLTVQPNGDYAFTLKGVLDHADALNPNDIITLNFGVTATDNDGDTASTSITVNVLDDAPVAHNDHNTQSGIATGNVITGLNGGPGAADTLSHDANNTVTKISYGGTTVNVPAGGSADIAGANGVLHINSDGSYTYTPGNGAGLATDKHFGSDGETFPDMHEGEALDANEQHALGIKAGNMDINPGDQVNVKFVSEGAAYGNTLGVFTIASDGTLQYGKILIKDGNSVTAGQTFDFTASAGAGKLGFFVIADGQTINGGYPGLDLSHGVINVMYDFGLPTQRFANINDDGSHLKIVFTDNGVSTVLNGPTYFTTERGGAENLNTDHSVRIVSAVPGGDDTVLRIGFEDLPQLGDKDYNDIVFDIKVKTPDCDCSTDVFTYTLTDGDGDSSTATVDFICSPPTNVDITVNNGADKICTKEDSHNNIVPISAVYTGGDGNEVMTLKVTGIQAGWAVTAPGWTNNGGGVYTLTLPAGQMTYNGNFSFTPPANSDVDMKNLHFTATVYDPDTATSKTAEDIFTVQVDAVIDAPVLTVNPNLNVLWIINQPNTTPLNISSKVTDTDGSEIITKVVVHLDTPFSLPSGGYSTLANMGVTLNKGTETSAGVWTINVNAADASTALNGLALITPTTTDYYWALHNGPHSGTIVVESFAHEQVAPNDPNNGECDFGDNDTCVIQTICYTFSVSPLVLDLDHNGVHLVGMDAGVMFDMNNNGTLDHTTWVGPNDGFLALDKNHDGIINNQSELFGDNAKVTDGFANLAQYDTNHDGKIDSNDAIFNDLLVWRDLNQDGISQPGELSSLHDLGIASINLNADYTVQSQSADGYLVGQSTYTTVDGATGTINDAWFNTNDPSQQAPGAVLNGHAGNDTIYGGAGNDIISGHEGNDILYGGGGDNIFQFSSLDGSVDTIKDFHAGDTIDISGILHGTDAVQDSINQFVFKTEVNGNTVISVDTTGSGDAAHATAIAVLENTTGVDLNQIVHLNQTNV